MELVKRDKSYFGAKRIRDKRGRGATGKIPVFGLLKRGEKVFTQIGQIVLAETLMPISLRTYLGWLYHKYRQLESL